MEYVTIYDGIKIPYVNDPSSVTVYGSILSKKQLLDRKDTKKTDRCVVYSKTVQYIGETNSNNKRNNLGTLFIEEKATSITIEGVWDNDEFIKGSIKKEYQGTRNTHILSADHWQDGYPVGNAVNTIIGENKHESTYCIWKDKQIDPELEIKVIDEKQLWNYTGNHRNGKPYGKGKWIREDFITYEGTYYPGKGGQGQLTTLFGNTYIGMINDEFQPNGHGTMSYSHGQKYIGNWEDGKYHGRGKLLGPKSEYISTGTYADGELTLGIKYIHDPTNGKTLKYDQNNKPLDTTHLYVDYLDDKIRYITDYISLIEARGHKYTFVLVELLNIIDNSKIPDRVRTVLDDLLKHSVDDYKSKKTFGKTKNLPPLPSKIQEHMDLNIKIALIKKLEKENESNLDLSDYDEHDDSGEDLQFTIDDMETDPDSKTKDTAKELNKTYDEPINTPKLTIKPVKAPYQVGYSGNSY